MRNMIEWIDISVGEMTCRIMHHLACGVVILIPSLPGIPMCYFVCIYVMRFLMFVVFFCLWLQYIGCLDVNTSMKSLDFETRSLIAK